MSIFYLIAHITQIRYSSRMYQIQLIPLVAIEHLFQKGKNYTQILPLSELNNQNKKQGRGITSI